MKYLSLFSGIEAATVAWHPLGFEPVAFAEIEPFPCAVLKHHYPGVPNLGDVTKADYAAVGNPDLIVFGSPCQSFSVAGKRLGLDDPRGNLALYALGVVGKLRPSWFLFENVPGLLSSGKGRDFGAFLGAVVGPPDSEGSRIEAMTRDESIDQFRQAFEILHGSCGGFREFRLIDQSRRNPPVIRYFSVDTDAWVIYDWISGYFGGYNCYVGRAVRSSGKGDGRGGNASDTEWISSASFDVDARSKPATDGDLEAALARAGSIHSRLSCGRLVLTGNGYQVWAGFKAPVDIRGRREWWASACKQFESSVVESTGGWHNDRWKVDPQYDIPRIVRLPGCPSVTADGRFARFVGDGRGVLDAERIIERAGGPSGAGAHSSIPQGHVPSRFWASLMKDQKLMESWSGKRADLKDTSGSGQDMGLVARLRAKGFSPEEALAILRAKPNKERSTEDYCERTVRKAYSI